MSSYFSQNGEGPFCLNGELSFATVNAVLEESLGALFANPSSCIELDLSAVTRADSAGLALLIEWLRMARQQNCEICFHHLPEQLLAIARVGELDRLLPLDNT